jgi:uncharacterized protein (DUF2252 family)
MKRTAWRSVDERATWLDETRKKKMARSPHAYVRGSTVQFYEWIDAQNQVTIPEGPPVWICGDCHIGNLGPLADSDGRIRIHIRDLDQTVIGNPAHDLIRLALSLASSARGSNLPGVTTAHMLEAIMDGYESAFDRDFDETDVDMELPEAVRLVMRQAAARTWKHLAKERLEDTSPVIPLGKRFWPISDEERQQIHALFEDPAVAQLATMARSRPDDAKVDVVDTAYWMKGCSSLGFLRYAVLVRVADPATGSSDLCLVDIKEGIESVAPAARDARMSPDHAKRVVEGARAISPFLGERMRAASIGARSVFLRELLPQDLKVEIEQLSAPEAMKCARFLAGVVGFAHARQMDSATRASWRSELSRHRSKELDAPSWLWSSVVELHVAHEQTYLEHCRRYALNDTAEKTTA